MDQVSMRGSGQCPASGSICSDRHVAKDSHEPPADPTESAAIRFTKLDSREDGFTLADRLAGCWSLADNYPIAITYLLAICACSIPASRVKNARLLNLVLRSLQVHAGYIGHHC
jgi:hypothetical protein